MISGAQTSTPAVSVSGPNAVLSGRSFDPPVDTNQLNTWTFNIIPGKCFVMFSGRLGSMDDDSFCTRFLRYVSLPILQIEISFLCLMTEHKISSRLVVRLRRQTTPDAIRQLGHCASYSTHVVQALDLLFVSV